MNASRPRARRQKLTREQTVRKMRDYLPAGKTAAARTLVAWEQGDSEPKVTQAIALARALGYHEFPNCSARRMARSSTGWGWTGWRNTAACCCNRTNSGSGPPCTACARCRCFCSPLPPAPASGWTTIWPRRWRWDDAVPARAEFGVRLAGDSMSPRFADGQIVWARKAAQAENGEIVLCVLNEQGYCKKLKYDADGVYLVSLNPAYEPIPVQEKRRVPHCRGRGGVSYEVSKRNVGSCP